MKTLVFTAAAAKQFDGLPTTAREALEAALSGYAIDGRGDVKKLQGRDGFRMRVGDYRILFDENRVTVLAVYIGRRQTNTY